MKKFFFIIAILFFALRAQAAEVYVSAPKSAETGAEFSATIYADPDGISINSVSVAVSYPEDLVSFSGYDESGGLLSVWIESPKEESGKISFSGIIPGGVSGVYDPEVSGLAPLPLIELKFTAARPGEAYFGVSESTLLKNDGKGTPLPHTRGEAEVLIGGSGAGGGGVHSDKIPPEGVEIAFIPSSIFSRTPSLIVFHAEDVDSGIKSYEMKVGASGFREAYSPEPLSPGFFPRKVTVRAYDFAGNFQEANILVPGILPLKWLALILLALSGIILWKVLKSKA